MSDPKILVTGASGQLGALVAKHLSALAPKDSFALMVRKPEDRAALEGEGFTVRMGDYEDVASMVAAFDGIERVLLISSSAVGQRDVQHKNVIEAAKQAGVGYIAYTSILGADSTTMLLAHEHVATEKALAASGLAYTLLRNGWYSENLLMSLPNTLAMGQHFGAAGAGKFSTATRNDFAEAAALVLVGEGHEGKIYELAGDQAYTLAEFAAMVAEASSKPVVYTDMPEAAFAEALKGAGVPAGFAGVLADCDARAADGALEDTSGTLSKLIGRPTEPMAETIRAHLPA